MSSSTGGGGVGHRLRGRGRRRTASASPWFTRSSVHWADRMVAHISWNGFLWSSSHSTSGYSCSRPCRMAATRAGAGGNLPRTGWRVALVIAWPGRTRLTRLGLWPPPTGGPLDRLQLGLAHRHDRLLIMSGDHGRDARRAGKDPPGGQPDRPLPLPPAQPGAGGGGPGRLAGRGGAGRAGGGRQGPQPLPARARPLLRRPSPTGLNCQAYKALLRDSVEEANAEMRSSIRHQCATKIARLKEDGIEVK